MSNSVDKSRVIPFADALYPDVAALRRAFNDPHQTFGPLLYLPLRLSGENASASHAERVVAACKKDGYAGVIPYYPSESGDRPFAAGSFEAAASVYDACAAYGLKSGYFDDHLIMEAWLSRNPDLASTMECRILSEYEHVCIAGETFRRSLDSEGVLMSLVAVEADTSEILDLRTYITEENFLEWQVPEGNWVIHRYVCEPDHEAHLIHMMDYDICRQYLNKTAGALLDALPEEAAQAVQILICRNVQYGGKNRRMWSERFNEVFQAQFGFDPAPYYPCLFQEAGPSSFHYRALLMSCRAAMLTDGYMKAAADFASARGMTVTGFAVESKATACSWLFGDGQMLHKYSSVPGISLPFAYLYGLNGIKVAAGISDGLERGLVSADIFRRYEGLTDELVYRETMNAFVRGVNLLMAHLGEESGSPVCSATSEKLPLSEMLSRSRAAEDYTDFCSRAGLLLRGGRHVSDIAVLYPIHAIHARTYLYDFAQQDFEYPAVLENADYMTVMNNLLTYACTDAEFLHPDILADHCHSDHGVLLRDTGEWGGRYSIVILPGTDVISVRAMRMLAKFFDDGGRILATECLPVRSFEMEHPIAPTSSDETDYDAEVRTLCAHIFGEDALDTGVIREVYSNKSASGGVSCFIPAITTAVDGTDMVPAAAMTDILHSFRIHPDFHFVRPSKIEYSGVIAYDLPTFRKIGVDVRLARAGSLGCLHRKTALCDVFYITNTTDDPYENDMLIRGRHAMEEWNPYKGKAHRIPCETVRWNGEVYTLLRLSLPASSSTFLVSPNPSGNREAMLHAQSSDELREYVLREY